MRKREYLWIALTLLLAGLWAGQDDVGPEIVAERQGQISHASQYPLRLSHPMPCDATLRETVGGVLQRPEQCYRRTNQ